MSKKITRRTALATGAATTGMLFSSAGARKAHAWPPGPDTSIVRDLTPGPTPIRLGGFLGPLLRQRDKISPTEAVKQLVDEGFCGCHTDSDVVHEMSDSELRELNAALKKYDLDVYEVGGYQNMIHPDDATRQRNLKRLATCLEAAEKVGCPMVGTCTGSRDSNYYIGVHPDNWNDETWKLTVDAVKQVLRDTAGLKAALGIEAQITMNVGRPEDHKRLMDDVGDKRCAVNLDPVNMMSLDNYYHTTELLNECFELLGEQILGCHAKDTYIWPDRQTVHVQEVCAGRGVMDYESYLVKLSRMKWPRTILAEHIPGDQYAEAYAYIRNVAAKVGVKMYR